MAWVLSRDEVIMENPSIAKLDYIMVRDFHQSRWLFTLHDSVFWVRWTHRSCSQVQLQALAWRSQSVMAGVKPTS